MSNIPREKQGIYLNKRYSKWKESSFSSSGFFPIFSPFKDEYILRNLSGNAVKLYVFLGLMSGNETGETWVSIESISNYFNKSERTISNWISELENAKLIVRFQLKKDGVAHTFLLPYGLDTEMRAENDGEK